MGPAIALGVAINLPRFFELDVEPVEVAMNSHGVHTNTTE